MAKTILEDAENPGVLTGTQGMHRRKLSGPGARVGTTLLTTQHSHKLLQQIQDLLDVHQVLGLQTLPKETPTDTKW